MWADELLSGQSPRFTLSPQAIQECLRAMCEQAPQEPPEWAKAAARKMALVDRLMVQRQ